MDKQNIMSNRESHHLEPKKYARYLMETYGYDFAMDYLIECSVVVGSMPHAEGYNHVLRQVNKMIADTKGELVQMKYGDNEE